MKRKKLSVLVLGVALALLLKTPARSQDLLDPDGFQVYVATDGPYYEPFPGAAPTWWLFWLWNGEWRGDSVNIFQISGIPVPPEYLYADMPGWTLIGPYDEGNGKTTVSFAATSGYEAQPGTWTGFWVFAQGTSQTVEGSYCAFGAWLGNCSPGIRVMSW